MKFFILIFFIANFFIIRLLSAHHDNSTFKSYYKIKHPLVGRILIGKFPSIPKIDKSKLSKQGIFLHILSIIALMFCIYMLFICPVINKEVFLLPGIARYGSKSSPSIASTLNDASSFFVCLIVFSLEMVLLFAECIKEVYNANNMSTFDAIFQMCFNVAMLILFACVFFISTISLFSF